MPETEHTLTATYADDTAILSSHQNRLSKPSTPSKSIRNVVKQLCIKANENKSTHVTFSLKSETCPAVTLNGRHIPQEETAKYLGLLLDRRLTWQKHIFTKRKQLGLKFHRMYWFMGRKSELSLENKLLIYKTILQPIWTYGIPLWGTASNSNIDIRQRFQNKAPGQSPTPHGIYRTVKAEIISYNIQHREKLKTHPNELTPALLEDDEPRRLKRFKPTALPTRYLISTATTTKTSE